eukprot:jgi/Mesen1/8414/ME000471S07732
MSLTLKLPLPVKERTMSRLSFRPRPLDIHKKLPIVRSVKELDAEEAGVNRSVQHNHIALDAENEEVLPAPARKGGGSEIPTPHYEVVESYTRDYLATFRQPSSYVRSKPARSETEEFVEYDLDDEDDDWLLTFNSERKLLSPEKLEWMLYNLELLDSRAKERTGGAPPVLGTPVPVVLLKEAAIEALRGQASRQAVVGAVYDYWRLKREKWQKPILRRLQPAPSVNDTNPFNVFRPREKANRPHTRRMQRRENDLASFEKLRQVRRNLLEAKQLLMGLQLREMKKRDLAECECALQQMHLLLKHTAKVDGEDLTAGGAAVPSPAAMMPPPQPRKPPSKRQAPPVEAPHATAGPSTSARAAAAAVDQMNGHAAARLAGQGLGFGSAREVLPPVTDARMEGEWLDPMRMRKRKRRRQLPAVHTRGPPPEGLPASSRPSDPVLLFTQPLDHERLAAVGIGPPRVRRIPPSPPRDASEAAPPSSHLPMRCRARVGRGGRIIFDRWNPFAHAPIMDGPLLELFDDDPAPPPPHAQCGAAPGSSSRPLSTLGRGASTAGGAEGSSHSGAPAPLSSGTLDRDVLLPTAAAGGAAAAAPAAAAGGGDGGGSGGGGGGGGGDCGGASAPAPAADAGAPPGVAPSGPVLGANALPGSSADGGARSDWQDARADAAQASGTTANAMGGDGPVAVDTAGMGTGSSSSKLQGFWHLSTLRYWTPGIAQEVQLAAHREFVKKRLSEWGSAKIPHNFVPTADAYNTQAAAGGGRRRVTPPQGVVRNPQTTALCRLLDIPFTLDRTSAAPGTGDRGQGTGDAQGAAPVLGEAAEDSGVPDDVDELESAAAANGSHENQRALGASLHQGDPDEIPLDDVDDDDEGC